MRLSNYLYFSFLYFITFSLCGQVTKNSAESKKIELLNTPDRLKFHIVRFNDEKSLNLEIPLDLIENIHANAKRHKLTDMKYQLEFQHENEIITEIPDSINVFLYGAGGAGKSTLLRNYIRNENTVNFYFSLH